MNSRASHASAVAAFALAVGVTSPVAAQTAAQAQLMQGCGGDLAACAKAARQAMGSAKAGGTGFGAFLNAAAAAVSAAAGQTVTPSAYGASPAVTPANPVAAIAAQQQYAQCVQNAGQNAMVASACVHLLPPEWAAMARSAQQAAVANPGLSQQAAQIPQGLAASGPYGASAYNPAAMGNPAAAMAAQTAYVTCIQSAGLNIAAASACGQPVQSAYGGYPGVAPQTGYNPVTSANAIAGAAGSYHACVMSVGVTNAAGVRSCQQRFLGR